FKAGAATRKSKRNSAHPGTSAKNCDRRTFLKNERDGFRSPGTSSQNIACICDLLEQARKTSRAFAISWDKLAKHRVHLRSPGRSSQTIAHICDLLGEARKPSRAISSIQRYEIKIRHGSQCSRSS